MTSRRILRLMGVASFAVLASAPRTPGVALDTVASGLQRAPGEAAGWRAVAAEPLFAGTLGRIRAVAMGPDGHLYITTSIRDGRGDARPGNDHLLRIVNRP